MALECKMIYLSVMIRTKYLVITLMFGVTIVLAGGVFFVHGMDTSTSAFAGETFFTVPQDRYDVSPITEKNYDSERKHFIEKVRNALVDEPRDSVAETVKVSEDIHVPTSDVGEGNVFVQEEIATTSIETIPPVNEMGTATLSSF